MITYLFDVKNWIAIAGFILSIINLIRSLNESRIKVDASIEHGNKEVDIVIYNHSSRKITVTYFEIYSKKHFFSFRKKKVKTWYDEGDTSKYIISPDEFKTINFSKQYKIPDAFFQNGKRFYIKIYISKKKKKTILLE